MQPKFEIKELPVKLIDNNTGQIDGVPENPRTITADEFQNLKKSLEEDPGFLWIREPIVYPLNGRYVAIGGNQRIRGLRGLPIEFTPAKVLDESTPVEVLRRWAIKDNTSKGEWDWDALGNSWDEYPLDDWGLEIPDTEANTELPDNIDDTPEPPKTPISKLGDVWLLGEHRVMCGDSTDKEQVEQLMAGAKADMVFTDPPYGMNLDTDYSKLPSTKQQGNKTYNPVIGDNTPFDFSAFHWIESKQQIWFGCQYYAKSLPEGGSWLVWDKRVDENFDKMIGSGFELAWSKTKHKQRIFRCNNTLFSGEADARHKVHPTQKPIKLCVEMIEEYSKPEVLILDLFLGSGSTLIACEQTDRKCYGMELDPKYVDVICKRYQTLTGVKPILEATGDPYDFEAS